jgi:hypothetical protein
MENSSPPPVRWVWILSLSIALFWIVVAAVYISRPWLTGTPISLLKWIITLLMMGNATVAVWLGQGLRKQRKPFYYLALGYLAINIVLTITDDFGLADLTYLLFIGVLFITLLRSMGKFIQK